MKPFNLERALAGEPVVTREGKPVHISGVSHLEQTRPECKILGWVSYGSDTWHINGKHHSRNFYDLFMAEKPKVKREGWVLFRPPHTVITNRIYLSENSAELQASLSDGDLIVARIEWEEEG